MTADSARRPATEGNGTPFDGTGDMRARCRALDWATTPLGALTDWSPSLSTAVRLMMASPVATSLWCGPAYTLLYNDAYQRVLGAKHPRALGRPGDEVWEELWSSLEGQVVGVRANGSAVYSDETLFRMKRREGGEVEEVWFTYSLSALTDETGAYIAVYNIAVEISDRVRAREAAAAELAELHDQQHELAHANEELQNNAAELEAQTEELQVTTTQLEERTAEAEEAARRAGFMGEIGVAITRGGSLREMMQRCCQAAVDRLDAAFARVWVLDESRSTLVLTASAGLYTHLDGPHGRVPVGKFKIGQIAAERRPHLTNAVIGDPRVPEQEWATRERMVAFAGYPLVVGGDLVGVMAMFSRRVLADADFVALGTAATAVSVAVSNARHLEAEERARKVAEEERARAEGILEAMADGHVAIDAGFRIIAVNGAMERGIGMARRDLIGHTIWDRFPNIVGTDIEQYYRRAATERLEAHFTYDYSDGRLELVVDVDVYPAAHGGIAVFWRDITARTRAAAEREQLLAAERSARADAEQSRAEADAANRAKGEFLAVMSHELRTPLNAIGGYAELMELGLRGPVTEEQRADLARIQQSQKHLLGLINQVLNYTRVETGKVRYKIVDVSVSEALAAAEGLIVPQVRTKGIVYAFGECDPALAVRADRDKLQQILLNLLTNAIKFTNSGGRITVTCAWHDTTVRVSVADTGVGIAADKLAAIFEPFVQIDSTLTRSQEGVGLGLAISRDLARGMDGDITATSTPGEGSTFTLTLPRAERQAPGSSAKR